MKAHMKKAGMKVLCDICGKQFDIKLVERKQDVKVYREFICPHCEHVYECGHYFVPPQRRMENG